jgi:hypothetical protein
MMTFEQIEVALVSEGQAHPGAWPTRRSPYSRVTDPSSTGA